jgi:hypothetical protein
MTLSRVQPIGGVAGKPGRTLAAVQDTLVDLRLELIGAVLNSEAVLPPGSRFGGLRGGSAVITEHKRVMLRAISYVPGVTLSGLVPGKLLARHIGHSATIDVSGAGGAHGTVRLSAGNHLSGELGGVHFDVRLAKEASASQAGELRGRYPFRLARDPGLAHTP